MNGIGLNILRLYPEPNLTGVVGANYRTTQPQVDSNTWLHIIKVDYQASSKLRISAKYGGQNATVQTNPGSMPGYNDTIFQFPAQLVPSATVVNTINNTTIFEGSWGRTQGNQLGSPPNAPTTNRNAVGLGNFPTLYPSPPGSRRLLPREGVEDDECPVLTSTGISRCGRSSTLATASASAPPNSGISRDSCATSSPTTSALSITKLKGSHTYKFGYVTQDSTKRQNVGTQTNGVLPIEGLRQLRKRQQQPERYGVWLRERGARHLLHLLADEELVEGHYVYHNKDFYAQDNWKMNEPADARLRHALHPSRPQYDDLLQSLELLPGQVVGERSAAALPAGVLDRYHHRHGCTGRGRRTRRAYRSARARRVAGRHHCARLRHGRERVHSAGPAATSRRTTRSLDGVGAARRRRL